MSTSSRTRVTLLSVALAISAGYSSLVAAADPPPKRPVPDYDGRGGEETTAGDVALWVPRIVLAPVYLVSEFLLRRPLGALVMWAERSNLPKAVYDLFTFGPDHSAGFAPIGFLDFGFNPSVGAYIFWNDAFAKGNDIRVHATTWGAHWLAGVVTDRVRLDDTKSVAFRFAGVKRPDFRFHGIGPDARSGDLSRYGPRSPRRSRIFRYAALAIEPNRGDVRREGSLVLRRSLQQRRRGRIRGFDRKIRPSSRLSVRVYGAVQRHSCRAR